MTAEESREDIYQRFIDAYQSLIEEAAMFTIFYGDEAIRSALADMRDGIVPEMPKLEDFAGLPRDNEEGEVGE